jgi:drug/metabolite transporter (DMT)-like permease
VPARPRGWLPVIGLFGVALSLGVGHVCSRLAFTNGVNVLTAASTRSALAALLLLAMLRWRRTAILPLPGAFAATCFLGLLIAAQTATIQTSVALMPVTMALLVFYTYPFFTGLVAALLGDARFSPRLATALAAAFGGLVLVLGVGTEPVSAAGVAAALAASAAFTAALVLTPRLAPGVGAPLRTFFMLSTAAAIFIAAGAATRQLALPANGAGWLGLAGLGVFYSIGIIGLFLLLPVLGPAQTAVVLNLEPVIVAGVAWLALGEALTALQGVGAVVVVAAVMFFQVAGRRSG